MADFKEVSLGFAEFVSQLIQETFDAILSSQNYQLEKYAELESRLELSHKAFVEKYIGLQQVETKKIEFFGFKIVKKMIVNEEFEDFINENIESEENLVYHSRLTTAGYEAINYFIENLLVEKHKSIINTLINKTGVSNLVVDSGEISAKLELSNLFAQEDTSLQKQRLTTSGLRSIKKIDQETQIKSEYTLPTGDRTINVIDYKDAKTGTSTILIDKKEIDDLNSSYNYQIPDVRLSVKPTKLTESSNLYSEIKINFKTV